MPQRKPFLYYWLPVIAYCLIIFIQSSFASPPVGPRIPHMDKLLHLAGYALLSILFLRAYLNASGLARRPILAMLCAFLSAALYGVSDELHQSLVSARQAEILDLVADTVGSAMGVGGYWVAINFLGIANTRQVNRSTFSDR